MLVLLPLIRLLLILSIFRVRYIVFFVYWTTNPQFSQGTLNSRMVDLSRIYFRYTARLPSHLSVPNCVPSTIGVEWLALISTNSTYVLDDV